MKKAFTLAEVLITLGIIGVVAAITLPILIQNYQKKVLVEQLKVGMSIFEQAFQKAMADDETTDLRDTQLFHVCDAEISRSRQQWADDCKPLMQKYFKDVKFESQPEMVALGDTTNVTTNTETCKKLVGKTNKWWYLNDKSKCRGWKNMAITLANGMRADFDFADLGFYAGDITALDINGSKGPNTWGRDTFSLKILNNGRVVPLGSSVFLRLMAEYDNADIEAYMNNYHWQSVDRCSKTTTEAGNSCAARIIESGWKMDY